LKKVNVYATLILSGSKSGKLYDWQNYIGLVGTPEYNLSKYLDNLIKPYIPDTYLLKSTDDFY